MGENIPIPDCATYINTSSDSCNHYWQPLTVADFDKISSITMTVDDMKKSIEEQNKLSTDTQINLNELYKEIKNKKENSKMDFKKILEMYEERKKEEIYAEIDIKKEKILEKDEIQKIIIKAEKEIKNFEEMEGRYLGIRNRCLVKKETQKKIDELHEEQNTKVNKIKDKIYEVKAQLNAIPNDTDEKYYFAIEILKAYEILDEKGRINA